MKRLLTFIMLLGLFVFPTFAQDDTESLSHRLGTLRNSLKNDYQQMSLTKEKISSNYDEQYERMVNIMQKCNALSLQLYSQKQEYTLDLCFALEQVKHEFEAFDADRTPYDRIVRNLDFEIERYERLIASLKKISKEQVEGFINADDERNRDTCIYYATELLDMYEESREIIVSDSIHYHETYLRLEDTYDYARQYYKLLQTRIFIEGQIPWFVILAQPGRYWNLMVDDMKNKYGYAMVVNMDDDFQNNEELYNSTAWEYFLQLFVMGIMLAGLLLFWLVALVLLWLVSKILKLKGKVIAKGQRRYIALLLASLIFALLNTTGDLNNEMWTKAASLTNIFLWLLAAILAALLIRLDPQQLKNSMKLYMPTIVMAFMVIGIRAIFAPNTLMNFMFPPLLLVFFGWQLVACLRRGKLAEKSDRLIGWISLAVTGLALLMSISGYVFASLLVLVWWYFQLAAIHTLTTIWYLITIYKEKRMTKRIAKFGERITFVSGSDKDALLFGVTWFYDLIKDVVMPLIAIMSLPFCIKLSLNVFDFEDLYQSMYYNPFYQFVNANGTVTFRISFFAIVLLAGLVFVFRYINKALHIVWMQSQYALFMRRNNRKSIRKNEINLSLGNSIISVLVWLVYTIVVIVTLHIPTGSLGLIIGGFSAGVGLALKDIINNFIYGIQLMTGRLKIGDWIECDGVRGYVTDISYQSTQVETIYGTTVSFLNASLFAKNFTNLTKSNSYEFLEIQVGVAYGIDMQRVRDILEKAMQVMRTKDQYGREVVEPNKGIYVAFGDFGESAVDVLVKQYVLAAERIDYIDKAKEVIYNALNENGIAIPFPQRDIHVIKDQKELTENL